MKGGDKDKKDVIYFYCESSLKAEFYNLSQEKGYLQKLNF